MCPKSAFYLHIYWKKYRSSAGGRSTLQASQLHHLQYVHYHTVQLQNLSIFPQIEAPAAAHYAITEDQLDLSKATISSTCTLFTVLTLSAPLNTKVNFLPIFTINRIIFGKCKCSSAKMAKSLFQLGAEVQLDHRRALNIRPNHSLAVLANHPLFQ